VKSSNGMIQMLGKVW